MKTYPLILFRFVVAFFAFTAGQAIAEESFNDVDVLLDGKGNPVLVAASATVVWQKAAAPVFSKNDRQKVSIASITKLMTAMVVLDARQNLQQMLIIGEADRDLLKKTGSRLAVGTKLTREQMLHLALMSSENRAASALARYYPGGKPAFIKAMNIKAQMLGLTDTRFVDSTGLNPNNVSTPRDLAKMVAEAASYSLISKYSTMQEAHVHVNGKMLHYLNSNAIVRQSDWQFGLSKTGFIREAGRCVVMQVRIHQEPMIIVLMNASDNYARNTDAKRIKHWLETAGWKQVVAQAAMDKDS